MHGAGALHRDSVPAAAAVVPCTGGQSSPRLTSTFPRMLVHCTEASKLRCPV